MSLSFSSTVSGGVKVRMATSVYLSPAHGTPQLVSALGPHNRAHYGSPIFMGSPVWLQAPPPPPSGHHPSQAYPHPHLEGPKNLEVFALEMEWTQKCIWATFQGINGLVGTGRGGEGRVPSNINPEPHLPLLRIPSLG